MPTRRELLTSAVQEKARPKRVLALDMAQSTGWAMDNAGKVITGTKFFDAPAKVKKGCHRPGKLWFRVSDWLGNIFITHKIELVVYENSNNHQYGHAARMANGLIAILEHACYDHNVLAYPVAHSTLMKHATGKGSCPKGQSKAVMLKAARETFPSRNFSLMTDDEVDALWLYDYAIRKQVWLL